MRTQYIHSLFIVTFLVLTMGLNAQIGMAGYYSDEFQGAKTASGDLYDMDAFTAGHKDIPYGTFIRVTRLDNKKSVVVRVNDRGPFYDGVVVDLSKAAARKLGMLRDGKVEVKVEIVDKNKENPIEKVADIIATPPKTQSVDKEIINKAPKKEPTPKVEQPSDRKEEVVVVVPKQTPKKETKPKPNPITKTEKKVTSSTPQKSLPSSGFTPKGIPEGNELVTGKNYKKHDLYHIQLSRPKKKGFGVQVASLSSYENAIQYVADLQGKWFDNVLISIEPRDNGDSVYKIILGPFDDRDSADYYKKNAKKRYKIDGFVVDLGVLQYH